MRFTDIPVGTEVFVDANVMVYHFTANPTYGAACTLLLERIEQQELEGSTSTHVIAEVVHRLMTIEACSTFGWPYQGIATRLRSHPKHVSQLHHFRSAIKAIDVIGLKPLPVDPLSIDRAADLSIQYGLLTNDAILVAVMESHSITALASNDADLDRVAGITRYSTH